MKVIVTLHRCSPLIKIISIAEDCDPQHVWAVELLGNIELSLSQPQPSLTVHSSWACHYLRHSVPCLWIWLGIVCDFIASNWYFHWFFDYLSTPFVEPGWRRVESLFTVKDECFKWLTEPSLRMARRDLHP
jgi:hypothetical protein